MEIAWYQYLFAFFSGALLLNALPHFLKGITGSHFPTPFAKPPGVGLSSPLLNIVWALMNGLLSTLFAYLAEINSTGLWLCALSGGLIMSFYLASYFGKTLSQQEH